MSKIINVHAIIVSWKNEAQIEIAQIEVSVTYCGVIQPTIALKEVSALYLISGSKIVAQVKEGSRSPPCLDRGQCYLLQCNSMSAIFSVLTHSMSAIFGKIVYQ